MRMFCFNFIAFLLLSCSSNKADDSGLTQADVALVKTAVKELGLDKIVSQLEYVKSKLGDASYTRSSVGYVYSPEQQASVGAAVDSLVEVLKEMTPEQFTEAITVPVEKIPERLSSSLVVLIDSMFIDGENLYDYLVLNAPQLTALQESISSQTAEQTISTDCPTTAFAANLLRLTGEPLPINATYLKCNLLGQTSVSPAQNQQGQIQKQAVGGIGVPYCLDDIYGTGKVCVPYGETITLKDNNPKYGSTVLIHSQPKPSKTRCTAFALGRECYFERGKTTKLPATQLSSSQTRGGSL